MGWSWDDYSSTYMAERSPFPISGNTVNYKLKSYSYLSHENKRHSLNLSWSVTPSYFKTGFNDNFVLPLGATASFEMRDTVAEKKHFFAPVRVSRTGMPEPFRVT